ncbi:MAG TPA: SsrA-binding protein SmpB [Candidatus Babeliales bacterium]|nr:SsrA-binding protein SmpB [Candidatus Babeliales bacterium]
MKLIARNKKAFFEYEILDKIEAGLVLTGDEVKSIRAGQVSLIGAFATVKNGELFLINCNVSLYAQAYMKDKEQALRSRKLLLSRRQLNKMIGDISIKGITIVPLQMYLNDKNLVKVELGLCKSKKAAGKKQAIKERDIDRQASRELKDVYKYK